VFATAYETQTSSCLCHVILVTAPLKMLKTDYVNTIIILVYSTFLDGVDGVSYLDYNSGKQVRVIYFSHLFTFSFLTIIFSLRTTSICFDNEMNSIWNT